MLRPGVIGRDGRTDAISKSLAKSNHVSEVVRISDWDDPFTEVNMLTVKLVAQEQRPDFIVVGPEAPLAFGVVDLLEGNLGIPCIGPVKELAKLESSKSFTRKLLNDYGIDGNPEYRTFTSMDGLADYLKHLGSYAIKPDGLTGGKGVKISGEHILSLEEALRYSADILSSHKVVIVEEKLRGAEFSLMSFCDGIHVKDMVVVQDHKRLGDGDTGPNTGGMGSYWCENHQLPFLSAEILAQASRINAAVAAALYDKTKLKYKGVLYGGFMLTPNGLKLLEYNARFGDPETLNALSILKSDFATICQAIVNGNLHEVPVEFASLATVCKYIVPIGYPDNPAMGSAVNLDNVPEESDGLRIYRSAISDNVMTGGRAIAFVGIGENIAAAEHIAEEAASAVVGQVHHRKDIGTQALIERHIKTLEK